MDGELTGCMNGLEGGGGERVGGGGNKTVRAARAA